MERSGACRVDRHLLSRTAERHRHRSVQATAAYRHGKITRRGTADNISRCTEVCFFPFTGDATVAGRHRRSQVDRKACRSAAQGNADTITRVARRIVGAATYALGSPAFESNLTATGPSTSKSGEGRVCTLCEYRSGCSKRHHAPGKCDSLKHLSTRFARAHGRPLGCIVGGGIGR